jgi:SAM-dependent methyltransferase
MQTGFMAHLAAAPIDRTRQFYETNSEEYSETTRGRQRAAVLSGFVRRLRPGSRVLDLGCGAGHDLKCFVRHGVLAVGLDYADAMAQLAQRASGAAVVNADMRALPFATGSFDAVWASASLHHVGSEGLAAALAECRRILKTDGVFFASVKRGAGEFLDRSGRFFALHDSRDWSGAVTSAGFRVLCIEQNEERDGPTGTTTAWLNSFATAA